MSPLPDPIFSEALPQGSRVRHGFFTRHGGVSGGIFASLNCGNGSADEAANVAENRARAARALGAGPGNLLTAYQSHGSKVAVVETPWGRGEEPSVDAMVTKNPGIVLGILAADCGPILLADEAAGVIGAAHAGWKGALTGIVEASVEAMVALGARKHRIAAALGPCIGARSYEVGPEFRERFAGEEGFFQPSPRENHYLFDLPAYIEARLSALGLASVEVLAADTRPENSDFFSYRRACLNGEPDYGRNLSAIVLAE
ncbi:MAG: peptidoglycan editing factor PgeF [Alphaproteobacteria bacterium]